MTSFNCIICANEFEDPKIGSVNSTKFKICNSCLDLCDPAEDYKMAKQIVDSYLNASYSYDSNIASAADEAEVNFSKVKEFLDKN
jgi:hypothetical protein